MTIYQVTDDRFTKYGKIIKDIEITPFCQVIQSMPIGEAVAYEPSVVKLETIPAVREIEKHIYGELPIEAGYCMGKNRRLNGLEYHKNSELNICLTDVILMLGLVTDIEVDGTYDTSKVEIFHVPAGTTVELYATTLHYAPCHVEDRGFQTVVILPQGTNFPLEKQTEGRNILVAKNKWLIGHPEADLAENVFLGLKGENISLD